MYPLTARMHPLSDACIFSGVFILPFMIAVLFLLALNGLHGAAPVQSILYMRLAAWLAALGFLI